MWDLRQLEIFLENWLRPRRSAYTNALSVAQGFTLAGSSISFLLVFRSQISYGRFWEGELIDRLLVCCRFGCRGTAARW